MATCYPAIAAPTVYPNAIHERILTYWSTRGSVGVLNTPTPLPDPPTPQIGVHDTRDSTLQNCESKQVYDTFFFIF